jgi:multidrug efflux pump subunit AcrA (membrane-fusion protein)
MESGGARKVLFDVPREEGSAVTLGHSVVVVDGPSGPVEGTVSLVRPVVDSRQRVTVEALLDGGEALLSGAVVPLRLEGPKRAGVVIPREALIESDGGQGVYAVREGTLLFLPVRSVAGDGRSLVVDGLNGGEHVVVRPYLGWSRLSPGQAVREIP